MTDINTADDLATKNRVAHALRLALVRWERLSSPPRHLQFPLVGCGVQALVKAEANARRGGRIAQADELAELVRREQERIYRLEDWRRGTVGRSSAAWDEVTARLWNARQDAVAAGVLIQGSQSYVSVSDRLTDCKRQAEIAERRERDTAELTR